MKNQEAKMFYGLLAIALLITPAAIAQDNPQSAIIQKQGPQSDVRVGVNPAKRVMLTLKDAMSMALENNRDIEVERLNVQMNEFDVRAAQGFYDPSLATTLYYDRSLIPATSIFARSEERRVGKVGR